MMQVAYVIYWWLALVFIGLISFPLVSRVCGSLKDKGYSISKIVGLIFLTFVSWMLASLKMLPFGYLNIAISILLLVAISFFFGRKNLRISEWPLKEILTSELIFTVAFILFILIRLGKPDIYFSGASDAVFNFAFIKSILHGGYMPPSDPWFAGSAVPYYYGGHYLVALLTKFTGVPATIAFNIASAMFYSLAVCAAYGVGYNLTKRKLYGFVAVGFVCILGYTSGAFQLAANFTNHDVIGYAPIHAKNISDWMLSFDFWTAPWLIKGAITHYPYFSFLMGDMHSLFMSVPFQIAYISLIFSIYRKSRVDQFSKSDIFLTILVLSICLGFFFILNTWEYPTYVIFTIAAFILMKPSVCLERMPYICRVGGTARIYAIVLSPWRSKSSIAGTSRPKFFKLVVQLFSRIKVIGRKVKSNIGWSLFVSLAVAGLSFILYLPYYLSGRMSGFNGIGLLQSGLRTSIAEFLEFCAPFLFIIVTFLLVLWKRELFHGKKAIIVAVLALIPIIISAVLFHFQIMVLVVPIGLVSLYTLFTSKLQLEKKFILLLIIMAMALAFFCDFAYIDDALSGEWERFNTILKIYHQMWVFLGVSAAYATFGIFHSLRPGEKSLRSSIFKVVWGGILAVLVVAALIHPIASTVSMTGGRQTSWNINRGTLDGMAYLEQANKGDYLAIQWINHNIDGVPVILEAPGEPSTYSSRVSAFTGLPTVMGWRLWEVMWRHDWSETGNRSSDVDLIYNSSDSYEAVDLLKKYNVGYVYIGILERDKYTASGLQKFDDLTEYFNLVYQYEDVAIYEFKRD